MSTIFHIGYPKSASTWLQDNFFPKIKNIKFVNRAETHDHFFSSDVFLYDPIKIRNIFCTSKTLLFSSESIVTGINLGWQNGVHAKTQADKIKQAYPDAKILIIVRNQQALITSAYQQFIKGGGVESFNTYLNSKRYFRYEHLLFNLLIEYYERLFEKENVYVYMYEDFCQNPRIFIENICKTFTFEIDLESIDYSRVNRGLRLGLIPLLKFFNLFHRHPKLKRHYVAHIIGVYRFINLAIKPLNKYKLFGRYAQPSDFLTETDLERIKIFYQASNNSLLNRFTYEAMNRNGYFL